MFLLLISLRVLCFEIEHVSSVGHATLIATAEKAAIKVQSCQFIIPSERFRMRCSPAA